MYLSISSKQPDSLGKTVVKIIFKFTNARAQGFSPRKVCLKESIRKRIFSPVHIHLVVTVRVTNKIPTIYPIISTQSSIENYAKMRLESRRLSPYLFTCDVTHSLSD